MPVTADTTHRACPVDGLPCWRERARDECPHRGDDGVRECVRRYIIYGALGAEYWEVLGRRCP